MILLSDYANNVLFGRKYRIIVSDNNGVGLDVSELHCTFQIEKSISETPNYSEVVIYDLSPDSENAIIKEGAKIVVEAGYDSPQYGLIFTGDIVQPYREKEDGITYKLTLVSQDGDLFMNNGIINASYRAGQTTRRMIEEIASKSSNKIDLGSISNNLKQGALSRGKVLFGLSRDCLRQIAKSEEAAFFINDGKINLVKAEDLPEGEIISLGPDSGLIGTPEQTDDGITAQCLLNPLLNLNKFVYIDNTLIQEMKVSNDGSLKQIEGSGVYRIIKITHTGDTRGDTWYTEFTAVAQAGAKPVTGESLR